MIQGPTCVRETISSLEIHEVADRLMDVLLLERTWPKASGTARSTPGTFTSAWCAIAYPRAQEGRSRTVCASSATEIGGLPGPQGRHANVRPRPTEWTLRKTRPKELRENRAGSSLQGAFEGSRDLLQKRQGRSAVTPQSEPASSATEHGAPFHRSTFSRVG
jgi:hypothetical protein